MNNLNTRTSRLENNKKKGAVSILFGILTWIGYFTALPILFNLLQKICVFFADVFAVILHFLTTINSYLIYLKRETFQWTSYNQSYMV
jgi:hypothetical protein